jgi:hypothetical protein
MDGGTIHTQTSGAAPPRAARLEFGATLTDGWNLFVSDWLALSVGIVIAVVLSILPPLVLAPVVWAGMARMVLRRVREGRPAEISDVFSCFDRFFALWGLVLVIAVVVVLVVAVAAIPLLFAGGFHTDADGRLEPAAVGAIVVSILLLLVMVVPLVYLETIWAYSYILVVDETRCGPLESLAESRRLVHASGFWMTFLLLLVVGLIVGVVNDIIGSLGSVIGMVTFGIGAIPFVIVAFVAYAYLYTCTTSMYFQVRGERHLLPSGRVRAYPAGGYGQGGAVPPYGQPVAGPPYGPPTYGAPPGPPHGTTAGPPPSYGRSFGPPTYGPPSHGQTSSGPSAHAQAPSDGPPSQADSPGAVPPPDASGGGPTAPEPPTPPQAP